MKIKKVVHQGNIRWRVNDHQGPQGKRQRKFFDTREDAERYARQRNDDRRAYGIRFATIPPSERACLGYHLTRLHALGWKLPDAVDFIERHGKAPPCPAPWQTGGRIHCRQAVRKLAPPVCPDFDRLN